MNYLKKLLMSSHFDNYITPALKKEMLKVFKTGNRIQHGAVMFGKFFGGTPILAPQKNIKNIKKEVTS